jgi:hypothetical protein
MARSSFDQNERQVQDTEEHRITQALTLNGLNRQHCRIVCQEKKQRRSCIKKLNGAGDRVPF